MIFWLLPVLLLLFFAAFGFGMLYYVCGRSDRPEGWEEKRVAESGNAAWQELAAAGRAWLAGRESEEITVQSDDGFVLHGLLIPHIAPRATVILFHGWRSSWEMDFMCILPFLHSLRLQTLLVDERAQGDSEGRWITYGVRERTDVPVWVDYAVRRFGETHPIFLQGLSMGAATVLMASDLDLPENVRGVIADCPFTSPAAISKKVLREDMHLPMAVYPFLALGARLFAGFGLREADAAEAVKTNDLPVLLIHGEDDRFVPCDMSRQIAAARPGIRLETFPGAGHGLSFLADEARFTAAVDDFLARVLEEKTPAED